MSVAWETLDKWWRYRQVLHGTASTIDATTTTVAAVALSDDATSAVRSLVSARHLGTRAARGMVVVAGNLYAAADTDTFAINGDTFRVVIGADAGSGGTAIVILVGDTQAQARTKIATAINARSATHLCRAVEGSNGNITIEAVSPGTGGNAFTLTESVANAGFTVAGATLTGGAARDQTKDAFWSMSAAFSMDSGTGTQLGGSGAAGTLGEDAPLPAATPLVAYLDVSSGEARTRVTGDTSTECYSWSAAMSLA